MQPYASYKGTARLQIVIPESLRHTMLRAAHDSPFGGGHFSYAKTYAKASERWWWPYMYQDTKHWCKSCDTCGTLAKATTLPAPLNPISVKEP